MKSRGSSSSRSRADRRASMLCAVLLLLPWLPSVYLDLRQLRVLPFAALAASGLTMLHLGAGRRARLARSGFFFLYAALGACLSLALAMGSSEFDAAFFFHFTPSALPTAAAAYPHEVIAALALLLVVASSALWLHPSPARGPARFDARPSFARLWPWCALLLGTAANPALLGAFRVLFGGDAELAARAEMLARHRLPLGPVALRERPKNIVLLYAESLERAWGDPARLGESLLPRLTAREARGLVFDRIRQVPGTGWTMAGVFASQCGLPLAARGVGGNQILVSLGSELRTLRCLGDVLASAGYETSFLQGSSVEFSGTRAFLSAHGVRQVRGKEQLETALDPAREQSQWGFHDELVLELGFQELERLSQRGKPFFLAIATVDTHPPHGTPGPSCKTQAKPVYADAVRCADLLIDRFLARAEASAAWQNTLFVVLSDHLVMPNTALAKTLRKGERTLLFDVFGAAIAPAVHHGEGTHFDVGPTLLDLAGFAAPLEFPLGQSLLTYRTGFVADAKLAKEELAQVLLTRIYEQRPILPAELRLSATHDELIVGQERFDLRSRGLSSCENCFRIIGFDHDGKLRRLAVVRELPGRYEEDEMVLILSERSEQVAAKLRIAADRSAKGRGVWFGAPSKRRWTFHPVSGELVIARAETAALLALLAPAWF